MAARAMHRLSAREWATIGPGRKACDGAGLWLVVDPPPRTGRKAVFRYVRGGKDVWHGLGPAGIPNKRDGLTLAEARERAAECRAMLRRGEDPMAAKRERAAKPKPPTFLAFAESFIERQASGWRPGTEAGWRRTIAIHTRPLHALPLDAIDVAAVLRAVSPQWLSLPATASAARERIEAILDAAQAAGFCSATEPNPAGWRALQHLLPKHGPEHATEHFAALDYRAVPGLVAKLRQAGDGASLALEFAILTAARSEDVLGAGWSEIDLDAATWTIPPGRMKSKREHVQPLSPRALDILATMAERRQPGASFVFPSGRGGGKVSNTALRRALAKADSTGATPHGMRSAFRQWAGDRTNVAREVAEECLAHVVGNAAEQAYRRQSGLQKRRQLLDAWCRYLGGEHSTDNVLDIHGGAQRSARK